MGRPAKYKTPEELEEAVEAYFEECKEEGRPYTMGGLAYALGFASRQSFVDYQARDRKGLQGDDGERVGEGEKTFTDIIKRARQRVATYIEEELVGRRQGNVAGLIFWLKNNQGWRDVTESHTTRVTADIKLDRAEVARRVAYLLQTGANMVDITPDNVGKTVGRKPNKPQAIDSTAHKAE